MDGTGTAGSPPCSRVRAGRLPIGEWKDYGELAEGAQSGTAPSFPGLSAPPHRKRPCLPYRHGTPKRNRWQAERLILFLVQIMGAGQNPLVSQPRLLHPSVTQAKRGPPHPGRSSSSVSSKPVVPASLLGVPRLIERLCLGPISRSPRSVRSMTRSTNSPLLPA